MTLAPIGYTILSQLYRGADTTVYRAIRQLDSLPVVLKILQKEYPTLTEIAQFRHEYEIVKSLESQYIVKPYNLENYQNTFVLVEEDFGGESLDKIFTAEPVELQTFLKIAFQLAMALEDLHQHQIIHKDIKPSNITFNPTTGEVKLIDFGLAIAIPSEQQSASNPNLLVGTLAYMSPEQTGRMNRTLDYRTDFYSLGITCYQLLAGKLPFDATDAMGWVHCHIAIEPTPLSDLNPAIPLPVSNIVAKLMAKTAEDRYQSAFGLKADLETCLLQLETTGAIADFPLGDRDLRITLSIPQKLYGREVEVQLLMDAFARTAGDLTESPSGEAVARGAEVVLVAGYSGIGKSALVQELYKPLARHRGYFIAGKYDQFSRNIPYSALIQAFGDLVRQLLTESADAIATWKQQLQTALGPLGQVLIDVIPEIQFIIGKQPPVPHLGASEAQNRFNLVFQKFVSVFASPDRPLVLFLDDLQWADPASFKLLELLLNDPQRQNLLLLGAYRDNEVNPVHPLMLSIAALQKSSTQINTIELHPLTLETIGQLLADTLNCQPEETQTLAEVLQEKTAGNPFFLTQLLQVAYQERQLYFDFQSCQWHWDLNGIRNLPNSDNVVELTISKIQQLSLESQELLQIAACIGNQFNLITLSEICQKPLSLTAQELWDPIKNGLLIPINKAYKYTPLLADLGTPASENGRIQIEYKFSHDRIQQAAYTLIPESRRQETHLQVGRILLEATPSDELEERVFELVNQLNQGLELIVALSEREQLARLNLIAGRKAKSATAYEAAASYLKIGITLLPPASWESHYQLTLDLYTDRVEAEYLNANVTEAENLAELTISQAKTLLEKVKIYEFKIPFYISQNQMHRAVDIALEVLKMLDLPLPIKPNKLQIATALISTKLTLLGKSTASLETLPEMKDPTKLAAMRIAVLAIPAIYMTNPNLLPVIIFAMLNLCVKYGNSALACYAYCMYGLALCGPVGDIQGGYPFGLLALKLLEKFEATELKAKVYTIFNIFVRHWKEPLTNTLPDLLEAVQSGFETGDLEYTSHPSIFYCLFHFFMGHPLEVAEEKLSHYQDLMRKFNQEFGVIYMGMYRQLIANLKGNNEDPNRLIGEYFDESCSLPIFVETENRSACLFLYVAKIINLYILGDFAKAVESAVDAEKYQDAVAGLTLSAEYNFYYSLALLAQYPQVSSANQKRYLKKVTKNQKQLKKWADYAPINQQHKFELIEAEKARWEGHSLKAMAWYDRAIQSARERECFHVAAIACERAGEFYLEGGRDRIAQTYLREARYLYLRWGCTLKLARLEARYGEFLAVLETGLPSTDGGSAQSNPITTSSGKTEGLDLATVLKSARAISGEILLDHLLENLLNVLLENAGAQRVFLLLPADGILKIEAFSEVGDSLQILPSIPIHSSNLISQAIVNYVERTQTDLVLNEAIQEGLFTKDDYIIENQIKSVLCAPILNKGQLMGIIYLENNLTAGAFTPQRLELVKILAAQAAISIENALLYRTLEQKVEERTAQLAAANEEITQLNERLKADNIRMAAELDVTRRLQQMILPNDEELEAIEGLEVAGFMEPADEVGGDYYDVLYHNGVAKIGIGDVTGHGLESGVLMIMAQTAVRALLEANLMDPQFFMDVLNRTIYNNAQRMKSGRNMTLALLDYQDGVVRLSGQHEDMIVVRSNGEVERIDTSYLGFPLGLIDEIADFVASTEVVLQTGDVVVLYTDGITEAFDIHETQYGLERLIEVIQQSCDRTAAEIKEALIADVRRHIGEQKVYDDITLVVLKQK